MNNFIKDCGDLLVSEIDFPALTRFAKKRLEGGAGEVSVNSYLRHIRVILNYSVEEQVIDRLPKIPFKKPTDKQPTILFQDQYELLLLHSKHCDPEMHRYIKFALWTGVRRSGIWSLTWDKVFDGYCVVILKGNKEHTVPLLTGGSRGDGSTRR